MNSKEIKIVIVDDHNLFRKGIEYLLSNTFPIKIIGTASNGKEFLKLLEKTDHPDLVFMDINMPEMNGIEACKLAIQRYPDLKIIALTMNDNQEYYYHMIQAGAKGFVLKNAGSQVLNEAIKKVLGGGSYFPEDILRKIIFKFGTNNSVEKNQDNLFKLTKREHEVLALLCQGYTNVEIAKKLCLSTKTIEGHRARLLSKTGTKNSAHLVMVAIKKGLLKI